MKSIGQVVKAFRARFPEADVIPLSELGELLTEQQAIDDAVAAFVLDQRLADRISEVVEHAEFRNRNLTNGTVIGTLITVIMAVTSDVPRDERQTFVSAIVAKMQADLRALNLVC